MLPPPADTPDADEPSSAANPTDGTSTSPAGPNLIRGQTSKHRGLRTFAQDRLRSRRDQARDSEETPTS
jgi:hypothetical protein